MSAFHQSFEDPAAVQRYAEGPPRFMPGYADMQRMATILLAEHAGGDAEILVLGAGGGLEMKVFAEMQPQWRFVGVDPAGEMLKLAQVTLGPAADRARWVQGYTGRAGFKAISTMHRLGRLAVPHAC